MPAFAIFGHPGHELFVLQWIADEEAEVFCLTNGSGGSMEDRTSYSRAAIETFGGSVGCVLGPRTDRQLYADLLAGDPARLLAMTRAIVDRARETRPRLVLTDALEYFNPIHDLANTIADIVVGTLVGAGQNPVKLVYPNEFPDRVAGVEGCRKRVLTAAEQRRKHDAIMVYTPLVSEFDRLKRLGPASLGFLSEERTYPDPVRLDDIPPAGATPYRTVFYEEYGARMIAAGRYSRLITLDGHVRPMARQLAEAFGLR